MKYTYDAVILAAGRGGRFGSERPKQFHLLNGRELIDYTIETFSKQDFIRKIIIVVCDEWYQHVKKKYPNHTVVIGGETRRKSTLRGIQVSDADYVFVHDAVRPFVSARILKDCKDAVEIRGANAVNVVLTPPSDTIVSCIDGIIQFIPIRDHVGIGQTPQVFRREMLIDTFMMRHQDFTDDCGAWIAFYKDTSGPYAIHVVNGEETNIKITTPADMLVAEKILSMKALEDSVAADLTGKRALVLGGTGGIGSECVNVLREYGAEVVACGSEVRLESQQPVFPSGQFDIIVYAAGVLKPCPIEKMTVEEIDHHFAVNCRGVFLALQYAIKAMPRGGHFVVIGSSSANFGRAQYAHYSASKAAVANIVQAAAEELKQYGIRVNCINPSRTITRMRKEAFGSETEPLLNPRTVAEGVVKLCCGERTGEVVELRQYFVHHLGQRANAL